MASLTVTDGYEVADNKAGSDNLIHQWVDNVLFPGARLPVLLESTNRLPTTALSFGAEQ